MATLRQAVKSKLSKTIFDGESRYRDRLSELLEEFDSGFNGQRLKLALKFLEPEWEKRDQSFLRKLSRWTKETRVPETKELLELAKFGSSVGYLSVQIIQNNLFLSYGDAFLRVLTLAALGLVERERKGGAFYLQMKTRSQIVFTLSVLSMKKFSDEETKNLMEFFGPEVENNHAEIAVKCIKEAINAGLQLEARNPGNELDKKIFRVIELARNAAGVGVHVSNLADEVQITNEMAVYILLVLAAAGNKVHRPSDKVHFFAGLKESNLVVWLEPPVKSAPKKEEEIIEIGSLSKEEAKELLTAIQDSAEQELEDEIEEDLEEAEPDIASTVMDVLQELEERLHAAQELEDRVRALETDVAVLKGAEAPNEVERGCYACSSMMKKFNDKKSGESGWHCPDCEYTVGDSGTILSLGLEYDRTNVFKLIESFMLESGAELMPKKKNNKELRNEAAARMGKELIAYIKNNIP